MNQVDAQPQFVVRQAVPADLEAILEVERRAFGGDEEAELVRSLVDDRLAFVPELSLVADEEGALIGHVLFTRTWWGARERPEPAFALLAPLAVTPERQRRGVGTLLVRTALGRARELGFAAALVLGDPAYYGRFGFAPAGPRGLEPPYPVDPPEAWMALGLVPDAFSGLTDPRDPHSEDHTLLFAEAFLDPALWRE